MKILIVGSINKNAEKIEKEIFIEACREIGSRLLTSKIDIIIASEAEYTADRYIFEGYCNESGSGRVWVLSPETNKMPMFDNITIKNKEIEIFKQRVHGSWSSGRVPQILAADAVLLIGGADGVLAVGHIAPVLQKPVLAIASFGGSAKELWKSFEPYYKNLGEVSKKIGNLREIWSSSNDEIVVVALRELIRRRTFKSQPRLPLGFYMISLILFLMFWVYLFSNPLENKIYSFFSMLGLAGLLGTLLRNNLRMIFDPTANFSWNELFIEFGAGLLLAFSLALMYLIGALAITGQANIVLIPNDDSSFQRVAVIMTMLGLAGGLMIENVADRIRKWFTEKLTNVENK